MYDAIVAARELELLRAYRVRASKSCTVWLAGYDNGPQDGGLQVFGLYSTEERAWAAIGKMDTYGTSKVVCAIEVDSAPESYSF